MYVCTKQKLQIWLSASASSSSYLVFLKYSKDWRGAARSRSKMDVTSAISWNEVQIVVNNNVDEVCLLWPSLLCNTEHALWLPATCIFYDTQRAAKFTKRCTYARCTKPARFNARKQCKSIIWRFTKSSFDLSHRQIENCSIGNECMILATSKSGIK